MTEHFANFSDLMEKRVLKDRAPLASNADEGINSISAARKHQSFMSGVRRS